MNSCGRLTFKRSGSMVLLEWGRSKCVWAMKSNVAIGVIVIVDDIIKVNNLNKCYDIDILPSIHVKRTGKVVTFSSECSRNKKLVCKMTVGSMVNLRKEILGACNSRVDDYPILGNVEIV